MSHAATIPEPTVAPSEARILGPLLPVSVFISGSIVMVLQVLGTRLISPVYGTSMHVWSALIAVTLLALAVGYWLGGILCDRRPHATTYFLIFELAALLIVLLPLIREPVLLSTQGLGLRAGALTSAVVFFAAPLTLLGMVSPFAVRLGTEMLSSLGSTAGRLYAISTAGSLAGTLLAGFYLIPHFRLRTLFLATAVALMLPAVLFQLVHARRHLLLAGAVFAAIALVLLTPSRGSAQVIHVEDSHFGQVKIVDEGPYRTMLVNGTIQGRTLRDTNQTIMAYAPTLAELAWRANPRGRWALVVGLGVGVLPPLFESFGARARMVEIDPAVVAAAERFFNFDHRRAPVDVADGRQFLAAVDQRFDYIVLDAFGGEVAPPHLLTREMIELIDDRLRPGGVVIINFVGARGGAATRAIEAIAATTATRFPHLQIFPAGPQGDFGNNLIVAKREPWKLFEGPSPIPVLPAIREEARIRPPLQLDGLAEATILSDDYNPLELWSLPAQAAWRSMVMEWMSKDVLLAD